jgi:hypothetical protein
MKIEDFLSCSDRYYVLWTKDIFESEAWPILLDISRKLEIGVTYQKTSVDLLYGILHEYWKPVDPEIFRPSNQSLLNKYTEIVTTEFSDTVEDSVFSITQECREAFGYRCSMNQLFSALEVIPNVSDVKKDLVADCLNICLKKQLFDLSDLEINKLFQVLAKYYKEFPYMDRGRDAAIDVNRIYIMALCGVGKISDAQALLEKLQKEYPLTPEELHEMNEIMKLQPEYPAAKNTPSLSSPPPLPPSLKENSRPATYEDFRESVSPLKKSEKEPYQIKTSSKDISRLTYISIISHAVFIFFIVLGLALGASLAIHCRDPLPSGLSMAFGATIIFVGWLAYRSIESIEDRKYQERLEAAFDLEYELLKKERPDIRFTTSGDPTAERNEFRKFWFGNKL